MLFDLTNFNGEVFDTLVRNTPNLRLNELLKSGAIIEKPEYAQQLPDQKGGHYITTIIKSRLKGNADNYDGSTDITSDERGNFTMGRIVVGRAHGWTDKDFISDITGDDYSAAVGEVAEYWDDVNQNTLISILKGIFSMTGVKNKEFVDKHTYVENGAFGATTLNNALQKALGDNKAKFSLAIMHSKVSTGLENLKLLEYMKYTDADGIERQLSLATINGRLVLVDDTMPIDEGYLDALSTDDGALKIVADSATPADGEIKLSEVTPYLGERTLKAGDYVVYDTEYTTYVFGNGAIEYTDCGVKTPSELERNARTNGGETTLISRQRKMFAPYGISYNDPSILSPTDKQLEDGSKWGLANNKVENKLEWYPHKAIPIARIKTRG